MRIARWRVRRLRFARWRIGGSGRGLRRRRGCAGSEGRQIGVKIDLIEPEADAKADALAKGEGGPARDMMPSFVNLGAYVDSGTMVDTWATVGSCAQIGKNVHISGGAGIGGVLEPLQAGPVIVEDNAFIGARSEVVEGVVVEEGAVISMGVFIGASTKIVDRNTGEITRGRVPAYSVVVPGTLPGSALPDGSPGPGLYCAVILKRVDERTRSKTSINELLRD